MIRRINPRNEFFRRLNTRIHKGPHPETNKEYDRADKDIGCFIFGILCSWPLLYPLGRFLEKHQ